MTERKRRNRGGISVKSRNERASLGDVEGPGFRTEDILWAVGIWTVILTLSPVIVFYMLMVA
jgi:hypothetical protein